MTVYKSCKVSDVQRVIMDGDDSHGYAFSILSEKKSTSRHAVRRRAGGAEIARAVEKAIEVTPQG